MIFLVDVGLGTGLDGGVKKYCGDLGMPKRGSNAKREIRLLEENELSCSCSCSTKVIVSVLPGVAL